MKQIFTFIITGMLVFSCKSKPVKPISPVDTDSTGTSVIPASLNTDTLLLDLTKKILSSIKAKNYKLLVPFIHPITGIRFSPYGYIDTLHDVVMMPDFFLNEVSNKKQKKIKWGMFDNRDEPISMTVNEYMESFVYDVNFIEPETIRVNSIIGFGTNLNNISAVYKNCDFTESHFSGFEKKYEGMDWRSLRLVFKLLEEKYYLVGIVHDQWSV